MVDDLIQKLRTCSPEEGRDIAMQLAQTRTDEVIQELIRMANGGDHKPAEYGKRKWYQSCRPLLKVEGLEFDFNSQLLAIEALGNTRSKKALEYLKLLIISEERVETCTVGPNPLQDILEPYEETHTHVKYINAKGELKSDFERWGGGKNSKGYQLAIKSIQKLESTVQNAPPNP